MDYQEYLQSPEWETIKLECRNAAGGKCEICGSDRELTTHHYNYVRLWREEPKDIFCLCWECHETYHRKLNGHPLPDDLSSRSVRCGHLKAVISGPKLPRMINCGAKIHIWKGSHKLRATDY